MQFQVPQFLETETKIVGPFTLRQFMWIAAGGGLIFMLNFLIHSSLFFFLAFIIAVASIAMAFMKIEGVPLPNYLAMAIGFSFGPKRYIFTKEEGMPTENIQTNYKP